MERGFTRSAPVPSLGPSWRQRRARRRVWRWVVSIIAIALIFTCTTFGISAYVAWHLTHAQRKPLTTTPAAYGLTYQHVTFPSRIDHLRLDGWLIPAADARGRIVIMAHGFRENRAADKPALPSAKALHNAGISVLMFDFRDEGVSAGHEISVGVYEPRDLLGAIDFARKLGYQHIGLMGFSMGAATALETAAQDNQVQAVVADSPFASLYTYLASNMPSWSHLPNWPFTSEILWSAKLMYGLDAHQADPLRAIAHWQPRPLLLIAGRYDNRIPVANSEALYNEVKANPQDQLWISASHQHVGTYSLQPGAYTKRVVTFFTQYLR
ncbi:MAG: alpha/beta hydrolase [Alicyclobacillus sp.]|nr:alpha/beta hydrolase [Alicyclobacillus sp.]